MEKRLLELLALAFQNELSENERKELDVLFQRFPEYQDLAEKLQFSYERIDELELAGMIQVEKEWKKLQKKNKRLRGQGRKMFFLAVAGMAAVFLLAIGMLFLFRSSPEVEVISIARQQEPKKVTLEYANGKTFVLDVNSLVMNDKGKITDHVVAKENMAEAEELRLNRLSVPKGCDFSLTLADGTVIRLNADSRLQYPSEFSGNSRIVYLEGEAFFNVAKDKTKPFIVKTKKLDVEVTGTSFNVMAYPSEASIQTTLVQGGVNILTKDGRACKLLAGEQCVVDTASGEFVVNQVNVASFVSWIDGQFFFDNESMESLMRKIARWYDVEVIFENEELKSELFYGTIIRSDEITEVLDILVLTKTMHYEIKDRTVYIRK
ncbi:MAG: DUF4974 domain-containing protein [Bacteroidales bacterium]|nr:DUF4974 domain-containing protein [Bacteroidales bacterium]